ncbi:MULTISPECIES: spore germination protein [Heyndrickxia]|mgnify:FL=1|uniref:spore germination protein n=1 Tax=Heyndrickxia TaxID=2837504 RepID=UPI001B25B758|nr:spore germination protein [Heyndrickxia oleronia]GIN39174.1 hypothetical protein J19TS1_21230 [Heyndrickxia oleronia]
MPSFVGNSQIINVGGTATIQYGDTAFISPKSASKTTNGAGSGLEGVLFNSISLYSTTNTLDTSIVEQPSTGNN